MEIDFHVEKRYQLLTLNSWVSGFLKFSIRYILLSCWLIFFFLLIDYPHIWQVYWLTIDYLVVAKSAVVSVKIWLFAMYFIEFSSPDQIPYLVENAFFNMYMTIYLPFLFSHGCISIIDLWLILHRYDVCGALVWRAFQWPYAREPRFLPSWGGKFCGFFVL